MAGLAAAPDEYVVAIPGFPAVFSFTLVGKDLFLLRKVAGPSWRPSAVNLDAQILTGTYLIFERQSDH